MENLKGKKVLVLGGSSGIGLATAKAAASDGALVTIVSSNQQRINLALKELPPGSVGFAVNLAEESQVAGLFERLGAFDHLVYTAGENLQLKILAEAVMPEAKRFFDLRYWGALMAVKYGAPNINTGGSIVLTGGVAALRPGAGWSLGASICAAMEGFTRAMAIELAPIRVNLVSPGIVRTNLWSDMKDEDRKGMYEHMGNVLPVKCMGEAEDLAQAYIYLMKQTYSTGQTIVVDGGYVLV